jgi:hypothetical protein
MNIERYWKDTNCWYVSRKGICESEYLYSDLTWRCQVEEIDTNDGSFFSSHEEAVRTIRSFEHKNKLGENAIC